ncbi:lysoplasmalogenase family protein [Catenisphaera adipataccumulans]|jgi:uncharacterized membrane protein YhhN|uniref:Putative membrane protein YhhN n=1 Tax=Catenisphaera adipataccumulans TaxID=700500 RepID=A0A7W8CWX2_9FIRM|nr:lysoplasmalogenase family protein [Catenisphaera adipataccumulans]MBB5183081.1 putative membrane protein YhhN [Catenisphaera adipataccumulans]
MSEERIFALIVFILMNGFVVQRNRRKMVSSLLWKASASMGFVLSGIMATYEKPYLFSLLMLTGLIFGLLGDIWLGLKWSYTHDDDTYLYAGFIAFLIGHVFYCTAMVVELGIAPVLPIILAIIASFAVVFSGDRLQIHYGKFRPISVLYGIALFSTMFMGLFGAGAAQLQDPQMNRLFLGGLLFLVSDLLLSHIYFGRHKTGFGMLWLNHFTYYAAQLLMVSAIYMSI